MAEKVWGQIQGFSGFGFPKAHSAAFGLLAYQSAWLRVHRPQEFLCALLNEQPMGFYPPDALVHEAQRRGVRLAGPDANRSRVLCHVERIEGELTVRIGLGYVKGVRKEEMESLVAERERSGDYAGIADLASRSGAGRDGLERLAWAGALDDLVGEGQGDLDPVSARRQGAGRREALWEAGGAGTGVRHGEDVQMALPLEPPRAPELKPLDEWERAIADYRSIGMTLDEHPMGLMRDGPRRRDPAQRRPGAGRERRHGHGGRHGRRPPAPRDRQRHRLHAARGRARHRQPGRPPARLRALPRRRPRRSPGPRRGQARAPRRHHQRRRLRWSS